MNKMNKQCLRCVVTGHVQGVWFRARTKKKADKFGLTGWVRNLPTGQVEFKACGTEDQLLLLREWLFFGPSGANVTSVLFDDLPYEEFSEFRIIK